MRDNVSQRLVAIETTQKLYHDEIKSITESQYKQLKELGVEVKDLHKVVYGGEKPGILENIRMLMWKFGIATTIGFGLVTFTLKLFSPTINKVAQRMVGHDDLSQYRLQQSAKKIRVRNQSTGKYEYFIEYTPVETNP